MVLEEEEGRAESTVTVSDDGVETTPLDLLLEELPEVVEALLEEPELEDPELDPPDPPPPDPPLEPPPPLE